MLRKIASKIGMDKAILFTVMARIFQGVGGIISVLLVATCLTGVEQGFYYTFGSILAIQIFFELGLGTIITQFVAHEKAHLYEENNLLQGEEKYLSRLASLLCFCLKWYVILAIAIFVIITIVGLVFFSVYYKSDIEIGWRIPWILLVIGTVMNFVVAPLSSFLEGLGKVKDIAKIRFIQQVVTQMVVWGGLLGGLKLYVVILGPFLNVIIFTYFVWKRYRKILLTLFNQKITKRVSYMKEIFPYQWKIALSWISGYFIFQLFNPVLFATEGAVVAGQMGMTLNILNAIMSLSDSWVSTKVPVFSGYIAKKEYGVLDGLFNMTLKQSVFIACLCVLIFISGLFLLDTFHIEVNKKLLLQRFLPYFPVVVMSSTIMMRQFQSGWALYLRCHKQEPLMWVSVITSILCTISTLGLGKMYGVNGMTIGYAVIMFFSTIAIYVIYKHKKVAWHHDK